MTILETIKTRRSLPSDVEKPVERALIEQIIEAGCWAPVHKKTEPWRFTIFMGAGRQKLQDAWNTYAAENGKSVEAIQEKVYRAPVVIAVWCAPGRSEKTVPVWEDEAAVSACCQNMLLAAHSLGLAAFWRSGNCCDMPHIQTLLKTEKDAFNAEKGDRIMGFIYLGHKQENLQNPVRETPVWDDKISWVE